MPDRDWNKEVKQALESKVPKEMEALLKQLLAEASRLHELALASMKQVINKSVSFDVDSVLAVE